MERPGEWTRPDYSVMREAEELKEEEESRGPS